MDEDTLARQPDGGLLMRYLEARFADLGRQIGEVARQQADLKASVQELQASHQRAVGRGRTWAAIAEWMKYLVAGIIGAVGSRYLGH